MAIPQPSIIESNLNKRNPILPSSTTHPIRLSLFAVLKVTGSDSEQLLQGQLTCNVKTLLYTQGSFAAFCNAKGRVISSMIVIKTPEGFLLLLPKTLAEIVQKKLKMYVLRSQVVISDVSEQLSIFGIQGQTDAINCLPSKSFEVIPGPKLSIKLPSVMPRFLIIDQESTPEDNNANGNTEWRFQDILDGFPWFEADKTEQYIPQALQIDQFDGISFNKGCYTGQEIIARTHYLGKSKRSLIVAQTTELLDSEALSSAVLNQQTQQIAGNILSAANNGEQTVLLIVLNHSEAEQPSLVLANPAQTQLMLRA